MKTQNLIKELSEMTQNNINEIQALKELPIKKLRQKESPNTWNALECIEHLNRYSDFYISEIRKRIEKSKYKASETFESGFIGDYFAKMMLPKENMNKINTFKSMNPKDCFLDKGVLEKFIQQQEQILKLLEMSKKTDLKKVKVSISIAKWIKLRLGDILRVVVYHNLRHIKQAKRATQLK